MEEANGNTQEALNNYKRLVNDYPNSPFFNEASLRVKILEPEKAPPVEEQAEEKTGEKEDADMDSKASSEEAPEKTPSKQKEEGSE